MKIAKTRRGWGEGRVTQLKSGRWRAVISTGSDGNGKRLRDSKTFKTKPEATLWLAQRKSLGSADGGGWTVAAWMDHWLAMKKTTVEFQTWRFYNQRSRLHVKPRLGTKKLSAITKVVVDDWHRRMTEDKVTAAQQLRAAKTLRAALEDAFKSGLITSNPTKRSALPKVRDKEMECWSAEQARTFLRLAAADPNITLWRLALDSGARPGELLALEWQDIDFVKGTVRIRRSLEHTDEGLQFKPPKTPKGLRVILIAPETVAMLKAHREKRKPGVGRATTDELVFPAQRGGAQQINHLGQVHFAKALKRCKGEVPRIRVYDMRHTCATMLLGAGVNVKVVADRLGHEDPRITLKHYAHAIPSLQEAARQAISALLSENGTQTAHKQKTGTT
ncbi:MAG: site-specific integrase [Planctomycetes bacterium]|nr:site-specific integrase [Planctomycetota bacterium]